MTRASFFFHFTAWVHCSQLVFVIFFGFISYNRVQFGLWKRKAALLLQSCYVVARELLNGVDKSDFCCQ
jgi:hypothetical protein